jgi:hypothetical protein
MAFNLFFFKNIVLVYSFSVPDFVAPIIVPSGLSQGRLVVACCEGQKIVRMNPKAAAGTAERIEVCLFRR